MQPILFLDMAGYGAIKLVAACCFKSVALCTETTNVSYNGIWSSLPKWQILWGLADRADYLCTIGLWYLQSLFLDLPQIKKFMCPVRMNSGHNQGLFLVAVQWCSEAHTEASVCLRDAFECIWKTSPVVSRNSGLASITGSESVIS